MKAVSGCNELRLARAPGPPHLRDSMPKCTNSREDGLPETEELLQENFQHAGALGVADGLRRIFQ